MLKILTYITITIQIFFVGNIGIFFDSPQTAYALSNTWDLNTNLDYTLSDDDITSVQDGYADLDLQLIQTGSIANNGTTVFLDRAMRVHTVGDYAYVSAQTQDRVQVIDISDPTNPTGVTDIQNNGGTLRLDLPRDIVSNGNYLYVSGNRSDAIQIIDISDPTNPIAAGNYVNDASVLLNGPRGLAIEGDYLYVAVFNNDALQIFDISIPTVLTPVGNLRAAGGRLNGARDIIVDGDYAYISARNDDSLQVIDISTPATPTFVGEIVNNGTTVFLDSVYGIKKQGDYIYATGYNQDRIQIIDVSIPSAPVAISNLSTAELPGLNGPRDVAVDGDFLFIADYLGDSIMIVDISDPNNPIRESEILNTGTTNINGPRDLHRVGNLLHASMFADDDFVSFETKYTTTSPTIIPNNAFDYTGENLDGFTQISGINHQGNISYQISKDSGTTWYYFDGSSWQTTTNGVLESSSAAVIHTNIAAFNALAGGTQQFLWKAFLNSDGGERVQLDSISVTSSVGDIINPTIDTTNFASGSLLPGGNHDIIFTYSDGESGINTTTATGTLHKWDGVSAYGPDISGTEITTGIVHASGATYSTNDLDFGKYQYRFSISDNAGNTTTQNLDFYIDIPEFIISTPEIDMGSIDSISNNFSSTVQITVRTVGIGFDVTMNADNNLTYTTENISSYNGSIGFGYQQTPYPGTITAIGVDENITSQSTSLNTNGLKNTYVYEIQFGGIVDDQQASGDYVGNIDFGINLTY